MNDVIAAFRLAGAWRELGEFDVRRDVDGQAWQAPITWRSGHPPVFGHQAIRKATVTTGEDGQLHTRLTGAQWRQLVVHDLIVPYSDMLSASGDPVVAQLAAQRVVAVRQTIEGILGGNVGLRLRQEEVATLTVIVDTNDTIIGCLTGIPSASNTGTIPGIYTAELMQVPGDARQPLDRLLTDLAYRIVRGSRKTVAPAGRPPSEPAQAQPPSAAPEDWLANRPDAWL